MKRVRVLKEMPFAKVGEEFEGDTYILLCKNPKGWSLSPGELQDWVNRGWLEWVEEEKSLEEEFRNELQFTASYDYNVKKLAQIATDHFKKKFDEAVISLSRSGVPHIEVIRKALFGGEE